MPTLLLAIDARKAQEGAQAFRRATKEASDAAGDAAKKTRDLEKAVEDTDRASQRAVQTSRVGRDEANRGASARANATREVVRAREETLRFVTAEERATREAERLQRTTSHGLIPQDAFGDVSGVSVLVSELGPLREQLVSVASRGQAASTALGGLLGLSASSAAGLAAIGAGFVYVSSKIDDAIESYKQFEVLQRRTVLFIPKGEDKSKASDAILSTASLYGQGVQDVTAANEAVRAQVRDAEEAAKILSAIGSLARASGENIAQLAGSVADLVSNYNLTSAQIESVVARTLVGASESGKRVEEYTRAVAEIGPTARQAVVGLDQIQALMLKVGREVAPGQGADAIRRLLLAITDEADPANAKLRELGVNLSRDANGSLDLIRIVNEIGQKTRGESGVIANVFGNRDAATVFALIKDGADGTAQAVGRLATATEEFDRIYRQQSESVTARNERIASSMDALAIRFQEARVQGKGLFDALDQAAKRGAATSPRNAQVEAITDEVTSRIVRESGYSTSLRLLRGDLKVVLDEAGPAKVVEDVSEKTVEEFSNATLKIRAALDSFAASLQQGDLPPIPIDIALQAQPQDVQDAYRKLSEAANQSPQKLLVGAQDADAMQVLEAATRAADAAEKSRAASLTAEREAQDAATEATKRATDALQKRARAQAEADRDKAGAGLRDYIQSLQEEVDLLSLDPIDREMEQARRKVESFTGSYREALLALGEDPNTVDLLIPDQSQAIDQVLELVRRLRELRTLQEQSPIDKYGPFIPDTPAPQIQAVEPFGPEFDAKAAQAQDRLAELQDSLRRETGLLGLSSDERERALYLRDIENEAIQAGVQDTDALVAAMDREFRKFQQLRDLDQLGKDFGRTMASGFEEAIYQAKSFNDAVRDIGRELSQLAFRQFVTKPLTDSLGSLFSGLFTGGAGAPSGGSGGIFGNGAAFDRGRVVAFAGGGIFDQPTYFPMSGGRTGVMGEAGPEAIMPLTRGPDGKLGVRASDAGSSQPNVVQNTTHVSMTVVAKDADSFKKSSAQITRDLKKRL